MYDPNFIEDLRLFGISYIMNTYGYTNINNKAIQWDTSPSAIRQMIQRNKIQSKDYVRVGQEYYIKKTLEKPTRKTKLWGESK